MVLDSPSVNTAPLLASDCHPLILQAHMFSPWHWWAEKCLYIRPNAKGKLGKKMTWRTKPSGGHSTGCAETAHQGSAGRSTSLPSVLCPVPPGTDHESKHRVLLIPVREDIQMEVRCFATSAPPFSWQGNNSPENGKYSRSYS